ncbi:DUF3099 domain-containing protein [Allosaccharopolyspora coralli]|uniref:DUF3099 domain-containing protein n=1 Tax=Allosaccharopolyspora coralli TaxID=2665642 RepID=UPI001E3D3A9B|nr:DUF3099 domain-containing protein [Allosaccharopolyspora coralli]
MNESRRDDDTPVLITEAQPSYDDQQAVRRRKYAIMMSLRIPCLVLGALVFQFWQLWWLSLIIVAISIPLPWAAVLVANDRPPRKREDSHRFHGTEKSAGELEAREHRIIDT